jgi:hypothetical protein
VPLTGVIETDWSPYTFTMNWAFTQAGGLRFEAGEPFCLIFPVPRGLIDSVDPEIRDIAADPETKRRYEMWNAAREKFNADLRQWDPAAVKEKWQKHYYRGIWPEGGDAEPRPAHQIKLRVQPFADKTGEPPPGPAPPAGAKAAPGRPKPVPRLVVRRRFKPKVK